MLGIILIYFIGKYFYKLAEEYHKSKWGFAILGVVSYYAGAFLLGIVLALYLEFYGSSSIEEMSDFSLSLIALPAGILSATATYYLLKWYWKKNQKVEENLIDDIGKS